MRWLRPRVSCQELDSPGTTLARKGILQRKLFLREIYRDWYQQLLSVLPDGCGPVLELGSGAGFLSELYPTILSSDILPLPHVRVVCDGHSLPFANSTLRAIVMTNVFHHLPDPARFLAEAARCIQPGGVIAMVEPWVTPWSQFVYRHFHHEFFEPCSPNWGFPPSGPLTGANGALPWIVFHRDRNRLVEQFPMWHLQTIVPMMPFSYLLSGGFSLPQVVPGCLYKAFRKLERALEALHGNFAMFALIVVKRAPAPT